MCKFPGGHLHSRAMANQKRADGADLWFVTLEDTQKVRDLADDPQRCTISKSGADTRVHVKRETGV